MDPTAHERSARPPCGGALFEHSAPLSALRSGPAASLRYHAPSGSSGHDPASEPDLLGLTGTYLTPAEVGALIRTCNPRTPSGTRDAALLAFLFASAARVSEALAVTVSHLALDGPLPHVRLPTAKQRRLRPLLEPVGLDPETVTLLRRWIRTRRALGIPDAAPLFPIISMGRKCTGACMAPGDPLHRRAVLEMLRRRATKAGIAKRVHPHLFRHSWAILATLRGDPLPMISRHLRHANVATTDTYLAQLMPRSVLEVGVQAIGFGIEVHS